MAIIEWKSKEELEKEEEDRKKETSSEEKIELLEKENESLKTQLIDTQLALTELFELSLGKQVG